MISILSISALAASVLVQQSLAAPISARDGCFSLGTGPLGFNASTIGIYNPGTPQYYLSMDDSKDKFGNDYMIAMTPNGDEPEQYEVFACQTIEPNNEGKGSITVYDGYIQTADGYCIGRDGIYQAGGHFSKLTCAYSEGNTETPSMQQHFQFTLDTFFDYYSVVFLGADTFPSSQANTSFGSGGHFDLKVADVGTAYPIVQVNYIAGEEQQDYKRQKMIAQLGDQYKSS